MAPKGTKMPPRGAKRAAIDNAAGQPVAKKSHQGTLKANCKAVVDILEHPLSDNFPEACRQMLAAMLPTSLGVPSDERHPHQTMVVNMIGEVSEDVTARMKSDIDAADASLAKLRASSPGFEKQKLEAQAKLAAAIEVLAEKKHVSAAASALVGETKALLSEKQQALKAAEGPLKPIRKEKESFEAVLRDLPEWEAGKVKKRCTMVVALAKKMSLDDSLTLALPGSLAKKPSDRSQFDGMVLQQFEAAVVDRVKQFDANFETSSASLAELAAAVEAAQSELEKRKEASDTAAAELHTAQSQHRGVVAGLKVAADAIDNYEPEVAKATQFRDSKVEELKAFQDWNVHCYVSLRDGLSAKKSKELAEAECEATKVKQVELARVAEASEAVKLGEAAEAAEVAAVAEAAQAEGKVEQKEAQTCAGENPISTDSHVAVQSDMAPVAEVLEPKTDVGENPISTDVHAAVPSEDSAMVPVPEALEPKADVDEKPPSTHVCVAVPSVDAVMAPADVVVPDAVSDPMV